MLFSTSAYARDSHGDVYFFIKRQAVWVGIGLVACVFAALTNYQFWQKTWWVWFSLALTALALCYIPHIGMRINGSRRWVGYGPITFQPSELAKIAIIFFLAAWFAQREKPNGNVFSGFILPLVIISVPAALVLGEVDLGTTALIGATAFVVMFVAGANPLWLGGLAFGALGGLILLFGWMGFNPGSTLGATDLRVSVVIVNTLTASTFTLTEAIPLSPYPLSLAVPLTAMVLALTVLPSAGEVT